MDRYLHKMEAGEPRRFPLTELFRNNCSLDSFLCSVANWLSFVLLLSVIKVMIFIGNIPLHESASIPFPIDSNHFNNQLTPVS